MALDLSIGTYDPCPCGSGSKYKFCCAARNKELRQGKYPIGTVACYGPDDKITTKIAASVILRGLEEPIIERFVGDNILSDAGVQQQIKKFFARHGVKTVVASDRNMGCPHEEEIDFPLGHDCPLCPFWAGKQGTSLLSANNATDDAPPATGNADPLPDADVYADDARFDDFDGPDTGEIDRIHALLGKRARDRGQSLEFLADYLQQHLEFPCQVTGLEDFAWEEPYIFGAWDSHEYEMLKKTQPSYTDDYELLGIDFDRPSKWMLFCDDLCAFVRRISDGRMFILGLAELVAVNKESPSHALLRDYAVWFVNSR